MPEKREPGKSRRRIPGWVWQGAGWTVSAVSLAWVLHDYPVADLLPAIRSLDWRWVLLAVVADLAVYVCHAWRWNTLLSPLGRFGLWRTAQSIYIGLFANELLPLRTGEVIRCYLMAHWNTLQISVVFASAALERILDGFWMVAAFLATATFVRGIPGQLIFVVQVIGVLLLAGAAILLWIVMHKQHAHSVIRESRWSAALRHIVEGLHLMGNPRSLGLSAFISLIYLGLQTLSVYALMRAFSLDLSFWIAGAVLIVVRFGTVVPNAPGNVGLFQAACVLGMGLFDVEKNDAKTFSFVMFFALTAPLLAGGAVAVATTGLNLGELHHRARHGVGADPRAPEV